jgi:leucine dehydrogenase
MLTCSIVAGGANNQLLEDGHGDELHRKGILYAPDYVINAGGIINVEAEIGSAYNPERARERTERIYDIMQRVIQISKTEELPTYKAADKLAEQRLSTVQSIKQIYRG